MKNFSQLFIAKRAITEDYTLAEAEMNSKVQSVRLGCNTLVPRVLVVVCRHNIGVQEEYLQTRHSKVGGRRVCRKNGSVQTSQNEQSLVSSTVNVKVEEMYFQTCQNLSI